MGERAMSEGQQAQLTNGAIVDAANVETYNAGAYRVVGAWHAEAGHVGAYHYCTEQPCRAVHTGRELG